VRDDADRHRRRFGPFARAADRRARVPQPGHRRGPGDALPRGGEGGGLEARHPGRRRTVLCAHGVSARARGPHIAARASRPRPTLVLRARTRLLRRGEWRGAGGMTERHVISASNYYLLAKTLDVLSNRANSVYLAAIGCRRRGDRRTSAARPSCRMADGWARFRHIRIVVVGDVFLPRSAGVGPDRDRRLDYRLAIEPAARDHSQPSDAEPPNQRCDRLLAIV